MNRTAGFLLGLGFIGVLAGSAGAADFGYGGPPRDGIYGGGVPVPAPVPIPEYRAAWYFRVDFGISRGDTPSASESGLTFGEFDSPGATGPTPFGTSASWMSGYDSEFTTWGAGVGYYWTPRLRSDITVEGRSKTEHVIDGSASYTMHAYDTSVSPPVYGPVVDGSGNPTTQVNVYVDDKTSVDGGFFLVNAYYDFDLGSRFVPYVGGGVGFAFNQISRTNSTTETVCSLQSTPVCDVEFLRAAYSATDKTHTVSFAGALTAGFSYAISDITLLDVNYRYLYLGGTDVDLVVNGNPTTVSVGEVQEHQLRAGLRFNVN